MEGDMATDRDIEHCLPLCLGRIQCPDPPAKFPIRRHGESNLHVWDPINRVKGAIILNTFLFLQFILTDRSP